MKKRLIILGMLILAGCASVAKDRCKFLYTDYRYDRGELNPVPVYDCSGGGVPTARPGQP